MADYVPLFKPGQAVTSLASAAITGGQLLAVTGDGTVGPAGAASTGVVGVAAQDAANGARVGLFGRGQVHRGISGVGGNTAGDPLIAGAAGTLVTAAAPPLGQQVGIALTTAAAGASVTYMEV